MEKNRTISFNHVLLDETGELRRDRPTHTKFGITLLQLQARVGPSSLNALTREIALDLYDAWWTAASLDDVVSGLDYLLFDSGIVCGDYVALRWLELCLFGVNVHHNMQDCVRELAHYDQKQVRELIDKIVFLRRRRQKSLHGWAHYYTEWTNRTTRVRRRALQLTQEKERTDGQRQERPQGYGSSEQVEAAVGMAAASGGEAEAGCQCAPCADAD